MQVSIQEAQAQLSRLLDLLDAGEEIVILRDGKPVARLVREVKSLKSPLGAMRGEFDLPEGWDRPLTDEESDAFWQGKW